MFKVHEKTNTFRSHQENDHAYIFGILQSIFFLVNHVMYEMQQCQSQYKQRACTPHILQSCENCEQCLGVPSKKKTTVYLQTLSKLRLTPLPPPLFLTNLFLTKC